ncbi:MAG: hypothetical protein N2Z70_01145 [Bdellovibrionaceae bacterium]|nr:hypothetical protein [Pseudobdellovibrionaceae bacterium]
MEIWHKLLKTSGRVVTVLLSWFFSLSALAFELKDQFGNSHEFSTGEGQILFAADMKAYKLLKSAMAKLQEPKTLLEGKKIFVVADISGMPGFISKYVAIPKMKELKYSIYLDATGEAVKPWPHEEGQLLLLKGDETGAWQVQQKFKTDKELSQFLSEG